MRLEAVLRTGLLTDSPTGDFDRVLRLAARCLDASSAAFLLVSGDGFHCRGSFGLPESWNDGRPWPLDWPFLLESAFEGPLTVSDAEANAARLAALPDVAYRAFAGFPLNDPEGNRLGILALWREQARAWTAGDIEMLRDFAGTLEVLVARRLEARRHEEELKASSERLRQAVESGSDLMYEWDLQTGALRIVGSLDRLLGYAPGEICLHHQAWQKVVHPEDRERIEARIRAQIEEGEPFFEEYRVLCKDGSVRHWSDRGKALRNAQGRIARWVGMVNDITERKRIEEALGRSREERDVILDTLDAPVLARDRAGRIVFANRAAADYLGFATPETLMAAPRSVISDRFSVFDEQGLPVDPEDLPGLIALRGQAQAGTVFRFAGRGDSRVFWSVINSTPVLDSDGRVRLSITAFHDITALKQAQIDLARGRDEMDVILRALDYGIIALDGQGRRLYANPAAARQHGCVSVEELLALTREDVMARFEILDLEGRIVPLERLPTSRALQGERVEEEMCCFRNLATGEIKWAVTWAIPVFDPGSGVRMVIFMMQDVTALQRAQTEVSRGRDELAVILRTMDSACTAQDASGNLVFANQAAAAQLGFGSPEELLGAGARAVAERYEVVDAEGRPFPPERFPGRLALQGRAVSGELMGHREKATGEMRWSLVNGTPVLDSRGNVRMAINVFHDITAVKRAEEALIEYRQRLDMIFRNVSDMVVLISVEPDGGFRNIMANPAYLDACRFPPEVFLGSRVEDLLPPGEAARVTAFLADVVAGRRSGAIEFVSAGLEKRSLVEARMRPILDETGRCTHILSVAKDVTDRKLAEEANAYHMRFLEKTDTVARAAETALDAEKMLPSVLAKVLEVMDCRLAMLVHPADADALDFRIPFFASRDGWDPGDSPLPGDSPVRELVRSVIERDGPVSLAAGRDLPDQRYWAEAFGAASILAMAVRPRAGKPWMFCLLRAPDAPAWVPQDEAVFRDIGTRISAALGNMLLYRDLRRSEEKYRTLFERSPDGVFRCAPDGTVLDANPAMVALLGCRSRADLVGDSQRQLLPAGGRGSLPGRSEPFIVELHRKDGGKVWAEVIAQAIHRSDGVVACIEGMVRNIDDRKRTEEALKENEEVLRQAQKMEAVGRLAGGVAHDFNNLLTAINGFGDLLLMQVAKDDPRRLHVEEIRKAGERAAGLTSQLLAFSRKQVLSPRRLDINAVVSGMEPMLRRLIGENIEFVIELDPDLPQVLADPNQAEQIVLNLALNARDAMPTGGRLHILTSCKRLGGNRGRSLLEMHEGEYALLSVTDTGVGMDDETKARLFEPFFTTKEKDKGTGLGLSMVYGAVKQGNGTIEVDTRKGQGTTFRVLLPAASKEEAAPAARRPTSRLATVAKGTETILLVEDEDAVRRLVRDVLQFNGYKVLEAPGGERALEVAEGHEGVIHLLLTDVVMGGMSGRELSERLQAVRPDTKVLYMSGYTEDAIIRHGVLSSQTAFIGKPFTPVALAAKVREVLTAAEAPAG